MVKEFPKGKEWLLDNSALRVSLDMTFDVPEEIAEQLELWGLNIFETCEYDPTILTAPQSLQGHQRSCPD